jgi:hypothetical protein
MYVYKRGVRLSASSSQICVHVSVWGYRPVRLRTSVFPGSWILLDILWHSLDGRPSCRWTSANTGHHKHISMTRKGFKSIITILERQYSLLCTPQIAEDYDPPMSRWPIDLVEIRIYGLLPSIWLMFVSNIAYPLDLREEYWWRVLENRMLNSIQRGEITK